LALPEELAVKVEVGDEIPPWEMAGVSAARMRTMAAILRDPNPVHWDPSAVRALGLGDHTINQGPLGLSYMINMLHAWTGPGSIRRVFMRFPLPVLDGDHVTARGRVTAVREEQGRRVADCDIWLERAGTANPLEGSATVLLAG
jgi:acyl dehydratase